MLLLAKVDLIPKKEDCKRNSIWPSNSNGDKVVFTSLLAKIVVLHMGPTIVDVRSLGLELVSRSTFGDIEEYLTDSI